MSTYDSFSGTYNLTTNLQRSPNKKWRRIYGGPAHWDQSDTGVQGVRQIGKFFMYPYQKLFAGVGTTSALTLSQKITKSDFDLTFSMRNIRALKTTNHKPWESCWLFWHFNENGFPYSDVRFERHFYYTHLGTDGHIQINRKDEPDNADVTRFLAGRYWEEPTFTFNYGQWYKLRLRVQANHIQLWLDDVLKFDKFDDGTLVDELGTIPAPSALVSSGKFGLYTEDAEIEYTPLVFQ